jgi:hypothetical protein
MSKRKNNNMAAQGWLVKPSGEARTDDRQVVPAGLMQQGGATARPRRPQPGTAGSSSGICVYARGLTEMVGQFGTTASVIFILKLWVCNHLQTFIGIQQNGFVWQKRRELRCRSVLKQAPKSAAPAESGGSPVANGKIGK